MPHTESAAVVVAGEAGGAGVVLCDGLGEDQDGDLRRR
jgi:hypothetical protein